MEKMLNNTNYSEHIKKYLESYGIKNDKSKTNYVYNEENLIVWKQSNDVSFYSEKEKKYVAEVRSNGDIFLGGNSLSDNVLCIKFEKPFDRCYTLNLYERGKYETNGGSFEKGNCSIAVSIDEIGNVSIYSCVLAGVTIKNGYAKGTASYYLNLVKEQLKEKLPNNNNWSLIELMFSDPRLLTVLNMFIDNMMSKSANEIYQTKQKSFK